ncbi:MAG: aminotransferase class I/II-fold pyridoxal phosphate-dependent enzyme [Candidatus Omnitrophota bacterium]|nr:MAG: aminotransferase class I/II-fold pyridoxal phosphate-dependent enzyme [Candidatus Omnitrophota bacterium]
MKFTIGFEKEDKDRLFSYFDEIIQSERWSEHKFTKMFEEKWSRYNNLESVAFSSWAGAALSALEFFDVKGKTVLCPANTFIATSLSVIKAGGNVEFVDCNRDDLCMDVQDLKSKIDKYSPAAVFVVHIGGHIAFQIEEISRLCKDKGIVLLEDCAHAHGADWNGKKAGTWGDAGIYSFYATKTVSTGEGGMLVTRNKGLVDYARKYRNYGKFEYDVEGLNYRMSEFTAAIGCIQAERLDQIIDWKNAYAKKHLDPAYPNRVKFPSGMKSGYYKYIVFDPIENSTGKVYDAPCHLIMGKDYELPNTEWIAGNHWCIPIYYKGGKI